MANNGLQVVTNTVLTSAPANKAASVSSIQLLAVNTERVGAALYNDSTAVCYVYCNSGSASATAYTTQMPPGAYFEIPVAYQGVVNGIWTAANGNMRVTEFA
jgi:hypothetical protein